jgi:TolA-binding protein
MRHFKTFFSMAVFFSAAPLFAAEKTAAALEAPTRAFEFEFTPGYPEEAIESYLGFIRKVSPGVDGLHTQYMLAELLLDRGEPAAAAQILEQLSTLLLSDDFFNYSVLQKLAEAYFRMGKYKESARAYENVAQGPVKALAPEATLGRAATALALGDAEKAHLHYKELTAFHPAYKALPRLQLPLGVILWETRKYAEALEHFKKDDKNPASLYYGGLCQRAMLKPGEAVASFRKIFQEFPGTVWADRAKFEMGETFYQQKDYQLAAQTFEEVLTANPSGLWNTLASYRLACADVQRKRFPEAEARFSALYKDKSAPLLAGNITYLLTEVLAEQKKVSQVVKLLEEQTQTTARSSESVYRLVWSLTAVGRYDQAAALANDSLSADWDPELTPKTLLVQGYAYEKTGRIPEALATYQLVVEHFSETVHAARALELMSMIHYRTGQYAPVVTQVLHLWNQIPPKIRKENPETLFWLGEVNMVLKNGALAVKFYRQFADSAKPGHPLLVQALHGMAVAAAQERDFAAAAQHLQRAAQAATDAGDKALSTSLLLDLANAYFNGRSYEAAARNYQAFQKADPQSPLIPFALYQEGLTLHRAEYYADAVAAWERLIKTYPKDPQSPEALLKMAKTQFDMGKSTDSIQSYQAFLKTYPKHASVKDAKLQIGQCYFNAGDYVKAIEAYNQFLKAYPGDPQTALVTQLLHTCYYQAKMPLAEIEKRTSGEAKSAVLADIYWEEAAKLYNDKKYPEALALFQKLLFEFPSASMVPQASFYRAESLFLMEKFDDAVPAFENFLQYYPEDPSKGQAMFHLAASQFSRNEFSKAGAAFKAFAQQFPDDQLAKNAALNAGVCYSKAGEVDLAVEAYLAYAATYPESEDLGAIYLQMGDFLEKANQPQKAAESYARVPANRAERSQGLYMASEALRKAGDEAGRRKMLDLLRAVPTKNDAYRTAGLLQLAEIVIQANDLKGAQAIYEDVAANAQDEQSVALAKEQLQVLKSAHP